MIVKANAKVNFTLEVLGVREDGYHDLRSIVVPISLADTIEITHADHTELEIKDPLGFLGNRNCDGEKNLIIKAVRLMQRKFGVKDEVAIIAVYLFCYLDLQSYKQGIFSTGQTNGIGCR